ncbi:MAG: very short patch repair endonuclease [Coriobacteriales bacterium]|jgi:DNA mismatch endonuclease (patch repair protein)|nr:very short patch repair endonuclease [Coriobacteriales bacterium]
MKSPPAKTEAVRKSMQGNKSRDTKPELKVRELLRKAGFSGYRLQWKKAPGHPDIAYPGRKIAIFVHGCFWHRCPTCSLPIPKTNTEYWTKKFERNVERDRQKIAELENLGWKVFVIWECELKNIEQKQIEYFFISDKPC